MKTAQELINSYKVIRSGRRTLSMEIKDGELLIRAPYIAANKTIDRFVKDNISWIEKRVKKLEKDKQKAQNIPYLTQEEIRELYAKAKSIIPERTAYYAPIVGVDYGNITIRCQKSRWGSCSAKGNLNFNCLMMLMPVEALDSVIVHELCHRKVMNHSNRFYAEVLRAYPEYNKWNKWIKQNGKAIMDRVKR